MRAGLAARNRDRRGPPELRPQIPVRSQSAVEDVIETQSLCFPPLHQYSYREQQNRGDANADRFIPEIQDWLFTFEQIVQRHEDQNQRGYFAKKLADHMRDGLAPVHVLLQHPCQHATSHRRVAIVQQYVSVLGPNHDALSSSMMERPRVSGSIQTIAAADTENSAPTDSAAPSPM